MVHRFILPINLFIMSDLKICKKCTVEKELIEFGRDKRASDGREGVCKECRRLQRHRRATNEMKKTVKAKKKAAEVPVAEPLDLNRPIVDEISMFNMLTKKHNTHISLTFHPHLEGCALQMQKPRFHEEGKDVKELIDKAMALPASSEVY